jgi:hypothetical protein
MNAEKSGDEDSRKDDLAIHHHPISEVAVWNEENAEKRDDKRVGCEENDRRRNIAQRLKYFPFGCSCCAGGNIKEKMNARKKRDKGGILEAQDTEKWASEKDYGERNCRIVDYAETE